jgi:fructokinase
MTSGNYTVVGLGELLWDVFPQRRQLGGAPANFAYISSLLGDHGIVASRVGMDSLGDEARCRLQHLRLPTDFLQEDGLYQTGTVNVRIDSSGQPQYEITQPVAWDFFEMTPQWTALAEQASAVCYGTLAQRSEHSRKAVQSFLETAPNRTIRVFDVNLRQAFFTRDVLLQSAKNANIIKMNHEELPKVLELIGAPAALRDESDSRKAAQWLLQDAGAQLICITSGASGSLLVSRHEVHEHAGFSIKVADTVGAGDAFTAALVHHFLRAAPMATMNEAANRMGAWVASQAGATPEPDLHVLEMVRNATG